MQPGPTSTTSGAQSSIARAAGAPARRAAAKEKKTAALREELSKKLVTKEQQANLEYFDASTDEEKYSDVSSDSSDESAVNDEDDDHDKNKASSNPSAKRSKKSFEEPEDQKYTALPRFGDEIPSGTKLVVLSNPRAKDDAWKNVRPAYKHAVRIKASDVFPSLFPSENNVKNWRGISLEFSVVNLAVAPAIRLTFEIQRLIDATVVSDSLEKPEHIGWVQFSFGQTLKHHDGTRRQEISDFEHKWSGNNKQFLISFLTEGGISWNLKCLIDYPHSHERNGLRLKKKEIQFLTHLADLTHERIREKVSVDLQLILEDRDFKHHLHGEHIPLDDLINILPGGTAPSKAFTQPLAYTQYRHRSGEVVAQHNAMLPRETILRGDHPGLPFPALPVFRDCEEALIVLANGSALLHEEQTLFLNTLARGFHNVSLLTIGPKVVASVLFSKPLYAGWSDKVDDECNIIPPYTNVVLKIQAQRLSVITLEGFVTADVFNINPGINRLLVVITNKTARDLDDVAVDFNKKLNAPVYRCSVKSQVLDNTAALRMNALVTVYGSSSTKFYQSTWPSLLSDGAKLNRYNVFDNVLKEEPARLLEAWKRLITAYRWNASQIAFIKTLKNAPGAMSICVGPGGSGKTALMCHATTFFIELGWTVLWVGARNASLDHMCEAWCRYFPDAFKPLRSNSDATEPLESLGPGKSSQNAKYKDQLLLELLVEVEAHRTTRRHGMHSLSVQQKVLDNLEEERAPMMGKFTVSSKYGRATYAEMDPVDFRKYFRACLNKMKDHPLSDREAWDKESISFFRQTYKALRAEVQQESVLSVVTPTVAGTTTFRQSFGKRKGSKGIARMDDESGTMSEPEALIPTSAPEYSKHIGIWLHFFDSYQTGYNPIAGSSTKDTLNEFLPQLGMSLSERLLAAGFPAIRMTVQNRMHDILFQPVNELFYNCSILTPDERKMPLEPKHRNLIPSIRGPNNNDTELTEAQARLLYVDIPQSRMMRSRSSGSKANPGFATFVVQNVMPALRQRFGEQTRAKCAIITPYRRQLELYNSLTYGLRQQGWKVPEMPQVWTIDSFQGRESDLVIIDLVNNHTEGFLRDIRRACVAFTRAKEMQIIIGGAFKGANAPANPVKVVRDVSQNNKIREIQLHAPLVYLRKYCIDNLCWEEIRAPKVFDMPTDLYVPTDDD